MNRYIRLDTMWDASAWLQPLSSEAQLVWIKLLCYAKNAGRDGRVKALVPMVASRMWFVGEESVRQLLIAADQHGAIALNGPDWVVTKWGEYQGDAGSAERSKRYRERQSANNHGASRASRVSSLEKEKEKDNISPLPPKGFVVPTIEQIAEYGAAIGMARADCQRMHDFYESKGWLVGKVKMKDWKAAARGWHSRNGGNENKRMGDGATIVRKGAR